MHLFLKCKRYHFSSLYTRPLRYSNAVAASGSAATLPAINNIQQSHLRQGSVGDMSSLQPNADNISMGAPRSRVASLRDLELCALLITKNVSNRTFCSYVNYPVSSWTRRKSPWSVKLLPSFGNADEGSCCSLVLIEMQVSDMYRECHNKSTCPGISHRLALPIALSQYVDRRRAVVRQ